jgi:hypothetical protein
MATAGLDEVMQDETSTAVSVRPQVSLAEPQEEFGGRIKVPYLAIAHGVGKLSESFNPGELVLAGDNLIAKKSEPLVAIILANKDYFREYRPAVEGADRKIYNTAEEALADGQTTEFNQHTRAQPSAPRCTQFLMLLEKPKDLICDHFCVPFRGSFWAPAYFSVEKMAYRSVESAYGRAIKFTCKARGIRSAFWRLWTEQEKLRNSENRVWVPRLQMTGVLSDEELDELNKVIVAIA